MFAKRFEFNKNMKLVINFTARENSSTTVYKRLSDDVKQIILDYIPGLVNYCHHLLPEFADKCQIYNYYT